jgi:hypothetical protein
MSDPRQCGECGMCCKLFDVTEPAEIAKASRQWCRNFRPKRGCSIYADRPQMCHAFNCVWLLDPNIGEEWWPAKSRIVITLLSGTLLAAVDPGFPDAWRKPPYFQQGMERANARGGRDRLAAHRHGRWDGNGACRATPRARNGNATTMSTNSAPPALGPSPRGCPERVPPTSLILLDNLKLFPVFIQLPFSGRNLGCSKCQSRSRRKSRKLSGNRRFAGDITRSIPEVRCCVWREKERGAPVLLAL